MCELNYCQSTAIHCIVIVHNDVTSESLDQRLITKEHIAMHTNLILLFKPALYSSTLVVKLFKSTVQLKGNVALAPRHTLALDVYNVEFYSFATQKSLYTGIKTSTIFA